MSREGRSQPIQPFAGHGFLGNTPANGVLPGRILVVENDDRRRKTPPLQPIVINGLYSTVAPPTILPPRPQFVYEPIRAKALNPIQPIIQHGFLGNTPANGTLPPRSLVVETEERRRVLAAFPEIRHGWEDPSPPLPELIENARRKSITPDPISIRGVFAPTTPPAPFFVLLTEDGRRRVAQTPIVLSGVLSIFFTTVSPPNPYVVMAVEDRRRRIASQPLVIRGTLDVAPPPVSTVRNLPLLGVG